MTEFLGRLHPLVVHLPIGFLVLLGLLELLALSPDRKHLASASGVILALAMPAAILSAVCGWLLSWSGGYDEDLLGWHKWLGVSVATATVILFFIHRTGRTKLYRLALLVTMGLVAVTGHLGGSLTHGSDYLTAPLKKMFGIAPPAGAVSPAPAGGTAVTNQPNTIYSDAIQPVFNDYCIGCHGPKKSKGGLRLDAYVYLDKGGKSGATIVPGSAALSLLGKRLMLPPANDDHMPPDGKRQPTADEVALLRWWIDSGAHADKTVTDLNPPADILKTIQARTSATR